MTRLKRLKGRLRRHLLIVAAGIAGLFVLLTASRAAPEAPQFVHLPVVQRPKAPAAGDLTVPIVFVSRQIPPNGTVYWDEPNNMPGVGAYSRFVPAAPGKLIIREPSGQLRVLIDGSKPTPASMNLVDVNAPDVSYDGRKIVFAGLPSGYEPMNDRNVGAWRIFTINVDGTGLRQVTFSDQNLDLTQFGNAGTFKLYDDTDPAWLPDGRIVFSSTRWPSIAHYSGARTTNLYVVNADGSHLHRITSERNGADRPVVDPITGKIVFSRWWRNYRFATNQMDTVLKDPNDPSQGYIRHNGLTNDREDQVGGRNNLSRNAWQIAQVNPDGTGVTMWGGAYRNEEANHAYGGVFTPEGDFIANYFPMHNMSEAAGFGGLRRYHRGAGTYEPILGITERTDDYVHPSNPTSYGVQNGDYASDAAVLPDGRLVVSWAPDIYQDYGLYVVNMDGSGLTKLYDAPGTTELRPKVVAPRPLPPVIPDAITQVPSLLPPPAAGPYDKDGRFVFDALNVYANAPVDTEIVSAPPVGSADKIRFFIDHQRTSIGSFDYLDWPILLAELSIEPDGSVRNSSAPANVPLFEQLRSSDGTVPLTYGPTGVDGATHVAGLNYGRPGEVVRCVGCHAGHSMIPVPADESAAQWSNLAPGADVTVSSSFDPQTNRGLVDRLVLKGHIKQYWRSARNQTTNQWVQLTFPVPVTVRTVRLYNPRQGDIAKSSVVVNAATVRLYSDAAGTVEVASRTTGKLSVSGTDVAFDDVRARVVRVELGSVTGTFDGKKVASLAEVEVIARGEAGP